MGVFDGIEGIAKFTNNTLIPGWKKKVAEVMEHVDVNNDNKVSPKEVFDALEPYGIPDINDLFVQRKHIPSPEEIWHMFDTNHDGNWSLNETLVAFKNGSEYFGQPLPRGWKKMVAQKFNETDTNGNGLIDPK